MKRTTALSLILFGLGLLIGIYPSFISKPGIDCIAGCVIGKGFPFPFIFTESGGITHEPVGATISYGSFSLDILILFVLTILPQLFSLFAPRVSTEKK